jgi:CMP-N,N'-diacetyllegionaminic acid synthase
MKKILAIIPARSGSKGLKNKNIKLLNDIPLMAHTIVSAVKSDIFTKIVVSTDSQEYKNIAEKYGAKVNKLRNTVLSSDNASTTSVILDVLFEEEELGNSYDIFILLQPTSPLRDENDIKDALELFINKKASAVVSVAKFEKNLNAIGKLDNLSMIDFASKELANARRQDEEYFYLNGAIYISLVDVFLEEETFYTENSFAFIMPKEKSLDIDDIYDFKLAEIYFRSLK